MFKLAVLSMKNRALIALVTIVAAVFGGLAITGLKQELIPSVTIPQLAVISSYPGASPDIVNDEVSTPIETAVQGISGLSSTSATSSSGQSVVSIGFDYGTELTFAEQKVTQAINRISSTLPEDVDPQVISGSLDDLPVIQLAVSGGDQDRNAQTITDSVIPGIEDLDGVREASLSGERGQRVTITPDEDALAERGLSDADIRTALDSNGTLIPAGEITEDGKTLTVQAGSQLGSVDDISALPVLPSAGQSAASSAAGADGATSEGATGAVDGVTDGAVPGAAEQPAAEPEAPATIGDVADVTRGDNPVTSISRVNGEPALSIAITKLPDANTVDVSTAVSGLLDEIRTTLGDDSTVSVVFDQAPYIQQSIETLAVEGLLGLVFAVLVILVFLLDVRATIVTAISIPTSVLITLIGLQAADYTLNILTLGALTIAIGRVVDDSIVVIENIKEHLGSPDAATPQGRARAVVLGVREVSGAITASTITTVAVFLPLAFVGDMTGELFRPFALTVSIALLASLLVSLTIVPVLAYWFLRAKTDRAPRRAETTREHAAGRPDLLHRLYQPVIHWTLRHSAVTVLAAVAVLVGTVMLAPLMKTNFLGDSGQNTLTVSQTLEEGASLDAQDDAVSTVEDALAGVDGIETVQVSFGSGGGSSMMAAFAGGGGSGAISYSITTDADADQVAVQDSVRSTLDGLDGVGDIEISAGDTGGFGGNVITVAVTAPTESTLTTATDALVDAYGSEDTLAQVSSDLSSTLPYVAVTVDREAAAEAGYSEAALGGLVSQRMQSSSVGTVDIDEERLNVYITGADVPATLDEIADIEVPTATGTVPLSDLATVEEATGPASISTEKGVRTATISITPAGDDLTSATATVTQVLDDTTLPDGASASVGGVSADQTEAFGQLGLALLAAILIVYVVMVAAFRSLLQPLLLLVSVPFAATGAIVLQVVTGIPLGIASLIGVLMLIGIVVTNAIVLVDLVNQHRRKGEAVAQAVEAGSLRRLRPILMTALATIFALTPMALGITGHGGFISQPLAIVVIGGLISSTVLTLVVLPTLYNLVEGPRERRAAARAQKKAAKRADAAGAAPAPSDATAEADAGPEAGGRAEG
ncbi:efflux RND transporter permease subunit [Mycetocola reblochoni]|uniref:RND multidrug efflux transporter Acriflavin resistance protein n=2 Tax=Mycetocola reblochoni TaxID=331618 RepID=A0A1R4IFI4_9MICO|nr:efflux RND transporter permease subunit [Mycetocola reblochoni]RLP68984.1 efflux RND transporter permease subunit [Mycetocola reblochoni]SJN18597.1 RND multidrug efflux transporter; Acriflavin resistance protein [Mycetocola reblochoni REB411]